MYTKKILSATAAVAIMSVGAMAFDMLETGTIIVDRINQKDLNATYTWDTNKSKTANEDLNLSKNDRGDMLVYPAFRSGEGWETEISVRNDRNVSVVAKAVIYAANDSHELKDFNLYLSSHDVAKFKIKGNTVTTRDGSIMAGLDKTLRTDAHQFVEHENPSATGAGLGSQVDEDGDFIIASFDDEDGTIDSGYVNIYVMAQTDENRTAGATTPDKYHNDHDGLYKAYYAALTECRGTDWKKVFKDVGGAARNGTATRLEILAPDLNETCDDALTAEDINFTAPDGDILFGEVEIYKKGTDDPRSLLLKATAYENYTVPGQMMLWAPGEYASIQDRRIDANTTNKYAEYNTTGICNDANDTVVHNADFIFSKKVNEKDASTLILTQPNKRALAMAGCAGTYWERTDLNKKEWGQFALSSQFYDENENADQEELQLVTITSPANSIDEELFKPEVAALPYDVLARDAAQEKFSNNTTSGYADININPDAGLPAIITEMVSKEIDGEAQINWIYSTVKK